MSFFSKIWEKWKDLRPYAAYLAVFTFVFLLGLLWHFPLEKFATVITSRVQKNTGYMIDLERLSFAFPLGLHAQNVQIRSANAGAPFQLELSALTIKPSIWSAITFPIRKQIGFSFRAERAKETWTGSATLPTTSSGNFKIQVKAKNFEWKGLIPIQQPMVSGDIEVDTLVNIDVSLEGSSLAIQQGNLSQATGSLKVQSKQSRVAGPIINEILITNLDLQSDLKKGVLNIKTFVLDSAKISIRADGKVEVAPFFPNSQIDIKSTLRVDPSESSLSSMLNLLAATRNLTVANGELALRLAGPLNSPERISITAP